MKIFDYHVHSNNSFDSKTNIKDTCASAVNKGISGICFTEHFSVEPKDPTFGALIYEKYLNEINEVKEKYNKHMEVYMGLEIGEPHLKIDEIKENIKDMDLDFIIGSVHNIGGVKLRTYMQDKTKEQAYKNYFKEILKAAKYGDFDVLGHLDLMKRYAFSHLGNYEFKNFKEDIECVLDTIIKRDKGIEINTSGLRNSVGEIFPKIEVLKLYKDMGGKIITIGSDSHDEYNIGKDFETAINMLKETGFKEFYIFKNRKPFEISIDL